ncbi:3-coathanger stack domain-containing protein [Emticicia sp. W12TSBA100-4]|uniref:3-coathanger stack domain-containing protein n=1 Tax=Emticicia sp. W12TSBA100-4 TaxID=3160965 RepID=UPI0033063747
MKTLLLLLISLGLFAQAPTNDDCENAIVLTSATACSSTSGTNVGVISTDYDNCAEFNKRNVWYRFTATSPNQIIQVTRGSIQNFSVDVWSNCSGTAVSACGIGTNDVVITKTLAGLTVGNEYFITVSTREEFEEGTFDICLITPTPPVNDECLGAVSLTVHTSNAPINRTNGTTKFASQSLTGCSGTADDDVWYSFTATQASHRLFLKSLIFNGSLEAQLFSGTCGALVAKQCISSGFTSLDNSSALFTSLTIGETYFFRVYSSEGTNSGGTFSVAITSNATNDNCLQATSLTPTVGENFSGAMLGSSFEATQSSLDCNNSTTTDDDVWYSFVATQAVHKIKVKGWQSNLGRIQAFSGSCASLVSLGCNTTTFSGDTAINVLTGLTAGQTYFFRAYSAATGSGQSVFSVAVTTPAFSVYDECSTAFTIPVSANSSCTNTIVTMSNAFPSSISGTCNDVSKDIYLKFVATSTQHQIKIINIENNGFITSFHAGTCGSLQHLRCGSSLDSLFNLGGLTIGQTYFIRIITTNNAFNSYRVCITTPTFQSNDECSGAVTITASGSALECNTFSGNLQNTSQSSIKECNAGTGNNTTLIRDIWYKFTATATQQRIRFSKISGGNFKFELYAGSCGTLTYVDCSGDISTFEEKVFAGLSVGNQYFIRVYSSSSTVTYFEGCLKTFTPPANDICTNATTLTHHATWQTSNYVTGSTLDANATTGTNTCGQANTFDVWYKFTAASTSALVAIARFTNDIEMTTPVVAVYSGDCNSISQLSCLTTSMVSTTENFLKVNSLTIGQTYFIRVYASTATTATQGSFRIQVNQETTAPTNNECATPTTLTIQTSTPTATFTAGITTNATASSQTLGCTGLGANDDDVWYSFTATKSRVRLRISATFVQPSFVVYSGTCTALTAVMCSAAVSGEFTQDRIVSGLTAGQTYLIRVFSSTSSATVRGRFSISLTDDVDAPTNDLCANATVLSVSSNNVPNFTNGSNIMAGNEQTTCNFGGDVWYKFTATATTHRILYEGYLTGAILSVYSGTCGALTIKGTCIGIANGGGGFNATGLTVGTEYFILVGSSATVLHHQGKFKIAVTTPSVPVNDLCSGAIPLVNGSFHSTANATGDTPDCFYKAKQDVWFSMVATHTRMNVIVENLSTNSAVTVYSGTCGTLSQIGCSYSISQFGLNNNSVPLINLTVGQTYFVRVISTGETTVGFSTVEIPLEFKIHALNSTETNDNPLYASTCIGTNLIPNPGFEYYETCPTNFTPTPATQGQWLSPNNFWKIPTKGSADYFNDCGEYSSNIETPFNIRFGVQSPRNGGAYAGFFTAINNYREYIGTAFTSPMQVGKRYVLSMWVSRADYMQYATNNIGFGLNIGEKIVSTFDTLAVQRIVYPTNNVVISDTENWVNISAEVTADQAYTHIYLGNFRRDAQTTISFTSQAIKTFGNSEHANAYYYVDDVFVGEITNTIACGANNCNSTIVLVSPQDNINGGTSTQNTNETIKANIVIQGSANVTFKAGKHILLNATNGVFEVKAGNVFKAEIGGCSN